MSKRNLLRLVGTLLVLGTLLFLFRRYFDQNGLLYGDSNLQWDRSLLDAALAQLAHSWAPVFGGGRTSIVINYTTAALTLLQEAVSFMGIPFSTVLVYPVVLAVAYAGCWIAARKISGGVASAHAVAIFFVGNPWIWDRVLLGHILIIAAVSVTPWILATIVYRDSLRYAFAPLLFAECGIMLLCDTRTSYMVFVGLVVIAICWLVSSLRRHRPAQAVQGGAMIVAPIVALLLNAWWTLPFLQLAGIDPVRPFFPPLEDVLSYSRYSDFAHNIVFSGSFLHFSWDRTAANGPLSFVPWYVAMLVVLLAAFFTRVASRTIDVVLHLGIVASLLISMGTALVPVGAALWLYAHVPMSEFFRDPNKLAFIAILCIVPLLSIRLGTASPGWRVAIMAVIVVAVLPTFSGDLRTTDGTGLQSFIERSSFVDVLNYVSSQHGFPNFRVGLIPPWTAEVSLGPGQHPVAEPFVFQYKVPTMDAKLINVASDMNMSAWRVFEDLYTGNDINPDRNLARLGIKYLIWDDSTTLSLGAANTPFFNVADSVVRSAVQSTGFKEVYRSGSLHVLENPAFESLVRGLAGPVIDGAVPERLWAVLPSSAIGDSVEAVDSRHRNWPFPTIGIGRSMLDACLSRASRYGAILAYDRVTAHADWKTYWVDSDYLQQGTGDAVLSRLLADYPLPYAFTESNATISFAIDVPRGARIAVEGGQLAAGGRVDYAIDQGPWKPLALPAGVLGWAELDAVSPGRHQMVIRGSRVGTVLREVRVEMHRGCTGAYLAEQSLPATPPAGTEWIVPSPFSSLVLTENQGKFSYTARNISLNVAAVSKQFDASASIDGPGADGVLLDHLTTPIDESFNVLLGYHRVEFFAKGAPVAASAWTHLFNGNPTGESPTADFHFNARYSEEGAFTILSGIAPGSTVLLRLPFTGTGTRAEVIVYQGQSILARYALSSTGSYLTMPAYGDNIKVVVRRERAAGRLVLGPPRAFSGVPLGDAVLDLSDRAARVTGRHLDYTHRNQGSTRLSLFDDNRALVPTGSFDAYAAVRGAQGELAYSGLRSSINTRCTVTIIYETAGGPITRAIADLDLGRDAVDGGIPVPILPRTTAFLPRFSCEDEHAILGLTSATLSFTARPEMGMVFTIPPTTRAITKPATIPYVDVSSEEFRVLGHPSNLVSVSSYDPAWQFGDNEHFIVNGSENGWIDSGGDRIDYTIQPQYIKDIRISLWLWLLLALSLLAALMANRLQIASRSPE